MSLVQMDRPIKTIWLETHNKLKSKYTSRVLIDYEYDEWFCCRQTLSTLGATAFIAVKKKGKSFKYALFLKTFYGFLCKCFLTVSRYHTCFHFHHIPEQKICCIHATKWLDDPPPDIKNYVFDYSNLDRLQVVPITESRSLSSLFYGRCAMCCSVPLVQYKHLPGDKTCLKQKSDGSYFCWQVSKSKVPKLVTLTIFLIDSEKKMWNDFTIPKDTRLFNLSHDWLWIRSPSMNLDYIYQISQKRIQLIDNKIGWNKPVHVLFLTTETFGIKMAEIWYKLEYNRSENIWNLNRLESKYDHAKGLVFCHVTKKIKRFPPKNLSFDENTDLDFTNP